MFVLCGSFFDGSVSTNCKDDSFRELSFFFSHILSRLVLIFYLFFI